MRRFSVPVFAVAMLALALSLSTSAKMAERSQIVGQLVWTTGTGAPSSSQVPAPSAGSLYTRTDTNQIYMYSGGAWVAISQRTVVGTITLDGSNPSSATTGLSTITACAIAQKRNDTPGDDPVAFTTYTTAVAGRLDIYAWKNTAGTDPTLVASTDSDDVIDYVCVGT